jgi:hypothetical protein
MLLLRNKSGRVQVLNIPIFSLLLQRISHRAHLAGEESYASLSHSCLLWSFHQDRSKSTTVGYQTEVQDRNIVEVITPEQIILAQAIFFHILSKF